MSICKKTLTACLCIGVAVFLASSPACVADPVIVDENDLQSEHTRVALWLYRTQEGLYGTDTYQLEVDVGSLLSGHRFTQPLQVTVYVYLPAFVSDVRRSEYAAHPLLGFKASADFKPQFEYSGDLCIIHWTSSSTRAYVSAYLSMQDSLEYYLCFEVPQNRSVTAYAHVQTAVYAYGILLYYRLTNENTYWLRVSNSNETMSLSPPPEIASPLAVFSLLGMDGALAAVMAYVSWGDYRRKRQPLSSSQLVVGPGGFASTGKKRIPLSVSLYGVFELLMGFFHLWNAFAGFLLLLPFGVQSTVFGTVCIAMGFGSLNGKLWAWYVAVTASLLGLINGVLFYETSALTIVLESLILLFLYNRRRAFGV